MRKKVVHLYIARLPMRIPGEPKNQEHEAGQRLLAYGLAELHGLQLCPGMVEKGKNGKPFLSQWPKIQYNISHSDGRVICGISDEAIGLDIERRRSLDFRKLGKKLLPDEAYDRLMREKDGLTAFFDAWVLMEAYLKWTGEGITRDTKNLEFQGWGKHLSMDGDYSAAIWSAGPLAINVRRVDLSDLILK